MKRNSRSDLSENKGSEILIRKDSRGITQVDVCFEGDDVWLPSPQIADLFQVSVEDVNERIQSVFHDGELTLKASSRQIDGIIQYNLDVVIALGFNKGDKWPISFAMMAIGTFLICMGLMGLQNL